MPKHEDHEDDVLVPLNILVPQKIEKWIEGLAYAESIPGQQVSKAEMARRLLGELYQQYCNGQRISK